MALPALPLELTDIIIDHLHADNTALTACSLVCRTWRGTAQHHLLSTVFCRGPAVEQLLTQLEAHDDPPRIKDAVYSSSPQVAGSESAAQIGDEKNVSESFAARVREVWVRGPQPGLTMVFSVETMARILAALPNLHTLHLDRVSLTPSDAAHARRTQGERRRYRLPRLDLATVYQANAQWLAAMLGLYAEVQELTLQRVFFEGNWPDDYGKDEERTRCQSLVVNGLYPLSFGVWRALRPDALKAFKVKFVRLGYGQTVCEMLSGAAGSLESLTLHMLSTHPASAWKPLSAIPWAALKRLSLVLDISDGDHPFDLTPISLLLSYLPHTISTIELKIDDTSANLTTLQAVGWNGLETQLSRFDFLRSLTLRLVSRQPDREQAFLETAIERMPTLAVRGLLAGHSPAQIVQA